MTGLNGSPSETKVKALRNQARVLRHQAQHSRTLSAKSKEKARQSAAEKLAQADAMERQLNNKGPTNEANPNQ